MIGFLGLGGCGGNIADEAQKMGFLSGAINYSQKDLDSIEVKHKLRLSGSEGVGKNRENAIALFQEQWETASKFVQDNFSNVDAIIFAFSSSGGSGSAISPILIEIISNLMPDKVLSAFVVVPDLSEAMVSQDNCLQTFAELSRLNISIFPIDNQQVKAIQSGKNRIYQETNSKSIELLNKIVSYTDKHSKNGNFDKKDFLTVLGTKGIATISEIELVTLNKNVELSAKGISTTVHNSLVNSVFVPVEFDKVTRAAIIFDGQEGLMELIDHELIFSKFSNGIPIDLFEGNYHESNGRLLFILTGLGWCNKRLQDIELSIEGNKDKIEAVLTNTPSYESKPSSILNTLLRRPPTEKKKSVMDILSKYKR